MLKIREILLSIIGALALVMSLAGCGQKGPLYTPISPAAAHRATLIDTLTPGGVSARDGAAPSPDASRAPDRAGTGTPAKGAQ